MVTPFNLTKIQREVTVPSLQKQRWSLREVKGLAALLVNSGDGFGGLLNTDSPLNPYSLCGSALLTACMDHLLAVR